MREMHKWKDKVELSLDNRQIFFLFFGLSVVGCFVFALGVMTGRRLQWDPAEQAEALAPDSLALLGEEAEGGGEPLLAFEDGLRESDADDKPATRDPDVPPATKEEIEARKAAAAAAPKASAKPDAAALAAAVVKPSDESPAERREQVEAKAAEKDKVMASAGNPSAAKPSAKDKDAKDRTFTLQFKAFSRESDAEAFADKLRRNGHEVRVEDSVVRGRTWYRVRLGHYKTWDEGLSAKTEFEKAEHLIAYVVSE